MCLRIQIAKHAPASLGKDGGDGQSLRIHFEASLRTYRLWIEVRGFTASFSARETYVAPA